MGGDATPDCGQWWRHARKSQTMLPHAHACQIHFGVHFGDLRGGPAWCMHGIRAPAGSLPWCALCVLQSRRSHPSPSGTQATRLHGVGCRVGKQGGMQGGMRGGVLKTGLRWDAGGMQVGCRWDAGGMQVGSTRSLRSTCVRCTWAVGRVWVSTQRGSATRQGVQRAHI